MQVVITATLKNAFERNAELSVSADTVRTALRELADRFPEAGKLLFDENNALRSFLRIFAGEEDVTEESRWEETLPDETELWLLPVIAGGAAEKESDSLISDERRKEVSFDNNEIERFEKHLMLREIGVKGQKRLKAAKVFVAGAGALGSAVIQYLAASGVGTIKCVDAKEVALSDLGNQVLHTTRDLKRPKTASAKDKVKNINRGIVFEAESGGLEASVMPDLIEGYDLVIDCTDNYRDRYLLSDACALAGIPLIYGAVYQFEGRVSIFNYKGGPCLRCLFPAPPERGLVPTCAEGGTISPLPGIIGSIQANEAVKLLVGIGEHLSGRLLSIDSLSLRSKIFTVRKNEACPVCGKTPSIFEVEDFDYEEFCGLKEAEEEIPVEGFTPEELAKRIENEDPITLIDVREPHERAILRFPNALVIPIGQLARRQNELNPEQDTIFICKEGKRSILAINTLREAGYKGPMYNLKGGIDAMKDIMFSNEGAWL